MLVENKEAIDMARNLARTEGIFTGISGGAAAAVGCKVNGSPDDNAKELQCACLPVQIADDAPKGSVILVMLPDTQERYQNSAVFAEINADMDDEEVAISLSTPSCQLN